MEGIEERLEKVHQLITTIKENREDMVATAVRDTGFTYRECDMEVDVVLTRLQGFDEMSPVFDERLPVCTPEQEVALVLPYNGSAWLNTAIISIYMVGNRVRVKFASRGSDIARLTESFYQAIFGDNICFDFSEGKNFLKKAIADPKIPAICLFGTDEYAFQYMDSIQTHKKKFVFEGPGKDPFIVLPGAGLEDAAQELAFSKYLYAGQTCTAPERVYLHESIHDDFLELFI
ncbi:MAG: aldehyde dehydrogenase family protein, partial [Candidatus Krumholzibacteria bacterium]|nr:aldehyde dehydrogenase family protein [Candidatus Krumholzibacteria bacterium]